MRLAFDTLSKSRRLNASWIERNPFEAFETLCTTTPYKTSARENALGQQLLLLMSCRR